MTRDPVSALARRLPRSELAGDWRLANAALTFHGNDGKSQPEELHAEGELHLRTPADSTVSLRLTGVSGIERVRFEFTFESGRIHSDGRAGSVDGSLRVAGSDLSVRLWFEFQAFVGDPLHQEHAVFTTDLPLGLLGLPQRGYATLELDFIQGQPGAPRRA